VYRIDDGELSPAPYESVMEHYPTGTTFEDLEMKPIGTGMFAYYSEIDIEDSDSEIYDEVDTDLSDFVVSDTDIQGTPPPDHKVVDKAWAEWEPSTSGGKIFKNVVDNLSK
jgi:translation elongation factor EF-1beta